MNRAAKLVEVGREPPPLRDEFLRWQCRVRQIAVRDNEGRPDAAIMPALTLAGETAPIGHIITVLCKMPAFSVTPEMQHMVRQTHDQAQRREKALQFLSATHYQKAGEFSDILTATFPPASPGAKALCRSGGCTLTFAAYGQRYDLPCTVLKLDPGHALFQATWWHNLLFNPGLHPGTIILGFEPDWARSTADPEVGAG